MVVFKGDRARRAEHLFVVAAAGHTELVVVGVVAVPQRVEGRATVHCIAAIVVAAACQISFDLLIIEIIHLIWAFLI